jgi:nucleoside-diphosphate-sugar epimerase
MNTEQNSFLVTGATGFIGRRLVARLSRMAGPVYCVVDADRGQASRLPDYLNVVPLEISSARGDLATVVSHVAPDIVFNLVAQGVNPASRDPKELIAGNLGFVSDLVLALTHSPPKIVLHIGSWSEYADPLTTDPIGEDHPIWPRSLYGAAKATATLYGNSVARTVGIPFVTLRLFNVYGPGETSGRLLPHLIAQLSRGDYADLTSGEQIRDFTYVDDVAAALATAGTANLEPYTAYNICSGRPVAVRTIAEAVADILGVSRGLLGFGALEQRDDEPSFIVGDNSRFHAATGWLPRTDLVEGIRLTIESEMRESAKW